MNWHRDHRSQMSLGDRVADWIAINTFSWRSVFVHVVWWELWFDLGLDVNLLTLIVSLEAILLCIFIGMSQNRQGDRDRHQANADYVTNLKAKADIEELMWNLARIEDNKLDAILKLLVLPTMKARKRVKHARRT